MPVPVITSLSKTSGPAPTGLFLRGSSFTGATGVTFTGGTITWVVNSDAEIFVGLPSGATSGTFTVTNASGSATSGTYTVTAYTPNYSFRVDSGRVSGGSVAGPNGLTYLQDAPDGGGAGTGFQVFGGGLGSTTNTIPNTNIQTQFKNWRYGDFTYFFQSVPASVNLEILVYFISTGTAAGQNVFTLNGNNGGSKSVDLETNIDLYALTGGAGRPLVRRYTLDGGPDSLFLDTIPSAGNAQIALVEVYQAPVDPPGTPTFVTNYPADATKAQNGTQITVTCASTAGTTAVKVGTLSIPFAIASSTTILATLPTGATSGAISVVNASGTGVSATNLVVVPSFTILGLDANDAVYVPIDAYYQTGHLFIQAVPDLAGQALSGSVIFKIDGTTVASLATAPYYLGGVTSGGLPAGYSCAALSTGAHTLYIQAVIGGVTYTSTTNFTVVRPSIAPNSNFSAVLSVYGVHTTLASRTAEQIYNRTLTSGAPALTGAYLLAYMQIINTCIECGIDISLDNENITGSTVIKAYNPSSWSLTPAQPLSGSFNNPFSVDACFNLPIPASGSYPKVKIPKGYFSGSTQVFMGGDSELNFGLIISNGATDAAGNIYSRYGIDGRDASQCAGAVPTTFSFPIRTDAGQGPAPNNTVPTNFGGDRHIICIDSNAKTGINSYRAFRYGTAQVDTPGGGYTPQTAYIPTSPVPKIITAFSPGPFSLGGLGDDGKGSTAARVNNLAGLVRSGELSDTANPIRHAITAATNRPRKARNYPADSMDGFIDTSSAPGLGGYANIGLVPYGGLVQLDPATTIVALGGNQFSVTIPGQSARTVDLPAAQLIRAACDYGIYLVDYSGSVDFAIYTAANASELASFGGYSNMQSQVAGVFGLATFYFVPPIVKRQTTTGGIAVSGSKGDYLETAVLNLLRGSAITPPANFYVALLTAGTDTQRESGSGYTEVNPATWTNYARFQIPATTGSWSAPSAGAIQNVISLAFANAVIPGGSTVTLTGWLITDSATRAAGNVWWHGDFTSATVTNGQPVSFDPGDLDIVED